MTKPLTEEIAKEYGYGVENFSVWTKAYCLSLDVEGRMDEIKSVKETSNAFRKTYIDKKVSTKYGDKWILNPNYIYIFYDSYDGESGFYIPVEKPFLSKPKPFGEPMVGVYKKFRGPAMYTSGGYTPDYIYTIEGVLSFTPSASATFMNWDNNPL